MSLIGGGTRGKQLPVWLLLLAGLFWNGCSSSPRKGALPRGIKTYSAEELGVSLVPTANGQAVRWRETVSGTGPVRTPMIPGPSQHSRQPYVTARVNGSLDCPFSIDTGAAFTLLNQKTALEAGVKFANPRQFKNTFVGIGGSEENFYGLIDELRFGELVFRNVFCVIRPAPKPGEPLLDNVLGMASIAKLSWLDLDFPQRVVTFGARGAAQLPAKSPIATVPFQISAMQLHTEFVINGEYQFLGMIDTGNDAELMLPGPLLKQVGLDKEAQKGKPVKFAGTGGVIETTSFELDKLQLAGANFRKVEATVVPSYFPPSIGSGFLDQFEVVVEIQKRRLHLFRK